MPPSRSEEGQSPSSHKALQDSLSLVSPSPLTLLQAPWPGCSCPTPGPLQLLYHLPDPLLRAAWLLPCPSRFFFSLRPLSLTNEHGDLPPQLSPPLLYCFHSTQHHLHIRLCVYLFISLSLLEQKLPEGRDFACFCFLCTPAPETVVASYWVLNK